MRVMIQMIRLVEEIRSLRVGVHLRISLRLGSRVVVASLVVASPVAVVEVLADSSSILIAMEDEEGRRPYTQLRILVGSVLLVLFAYLIISLSLEGTPFPKLWKKES